MRPILVTGAAKGLGAEIALHLAAQGHDIVVHYRESEQAAQDVVDRCRIFGVNVKKIAGDLSTSTSVEDFIESYRGLYPNTKGIVNNVGNYDTNSPLEEKGEEVLFQANCFAPVRLIRGLIGSIRVQRGAIVNLGVAGLREGRAWGKATGYGAAKSTLWFYTRSLAKELAPDGVSVNMVSPGFLEGSFGLDDETELPMKRAGEFDEVARMVAFLLDEENRYITGQNIEVAGGLTL